jgi:outer membrane protein assembly factor BamA
LTRCGARRARRWLFAIALAGSPALARENLETERLLADVIQQGEMEKEGSIPRSQGWAVLPQVGYSPEKGPNGGIKFTDRNATASRLTIDFEGGYALKGQQTVAFAVLAPHLLDDVVIAAIQGEYAYDPTKEFFGLGNNDVGPDPLSTNSYRPFSALATLAIRPMRRLNAAFTIGLSYVQIGEGVLEDSTPSTEEAFPDLVGIKGGWSNPISFSLVYTNREEITRPTRGWNLIAKVQHVNKNLGSDYQFTRFIADASYLYPFLTRRQVLGLRVGGEYIDAKSREVPFYEFASLGGAHDLRGFFQDRFLGRSRLMINGEYRLKLFDFNFFDWWHVRIDGVAFGDMGRVFLDDADVKSQLGASDFVPSVFRDFRYSYGGGMRIALGEAILARIDVGFSNEETGLVYLTFGHIF